MTRRDIHSGDLEEVVPVLAEIAIKEPARFIIFGLWDSGGQELLVVAIVQPEEKPIFIKNQVGLARAYA